MPPQQTHVRRKLNLDLIFNDPLINVTGEPITPTKIAIFYLIRKLFHAHFGIGPIPSLEPFNKEEKTKAFSIVYGLILMESEISYDDFRQVVRILNDEIGRSIYYHFIISMEQLAYGDEQIEMLFEDAFYTGKRPKHGTIPQNRKMGADELSFMSKYSFLYIWIKRVMIQYTRTSQNGLFVLTEKIREWVTTGNMRNVSICYFGINQFLPFEIDCSVRARQWINQQLQLIQFSPTKAMRYDQALNWCQIISQRHRDILEVNLLKSVVFIQTKNQPDALNSLKTFFDLSMLQLTESAKQALDSLRLLAASPVALRYGPILQGRIHRLFGNRKAAGDLFAESIQQSQLNNDDMCNRLANMELTINEILTSGPILERTPGGKPKNEQECDDANKRGERRAFLDTIHAAANINIPHIRALQKSFKEDFELHTYLVAMSKFMLCVENMLDGKFFRYNSSADYAFVGFHRLRLIYDSQNKGRVIEDFANAIMSSGLIQCGMYKQARRVAESMLVNNFSSPSCPKFETESQAVAGVNLAYSHAAVGNYDSAFKTISSLEIMFPDNINWMSARHVKICTYIIRFERDFLLNRYSACSAHLRNLSSPAPLEFTLRKALLLATTGKLSDGLRLLKTYACEDVRGLMRIHMQLATIHTGHGHFEKADHHLEEAGKISINTHFRDANALVARRVGSVLLARNMPSEACQIMLAVAHKLENFGSFIEKAVLYASIARSFRLIKKDPRPYLKKCKSLIMDNKWPAMEKLILTELELLHNQGGMFSDENKSTWAKERFGEIESDHPGACSWLLI